MRATRAVVMRLRERGKGCKRHSGHKIAIAWQLVGYNGSERELEGNLNMEAGEKSATN